MSDDMEYFADVTVEDFLRMTSAICDTSLSQDDRAELDKRGAFTRFVQGMLVSAQTVAGILPNNFPAFAVLVSADRRRYFRPDDDETAKHWAERLQREARAMNATHMFVAMCAPARVYQPGAPVVPINPNDPQQLQAALQAGTIQLSICWFAERRDDHKRTKRGGVISLDAAGAPTDVVEGDIDNTKNPFAQVMDR